LALFLVLSLEKPHVFRRKTGWFASAGTDRAGCQDLAEGPPQRGAKRVFTHGAVLAVVVVAGGKVRRFYRSFPWASVCRYRQALRLVVLACVFAADVDAPTVRQDVGISAPLLPEQASIGTDRKGRSTLSTRP
jgi:hypothetical protein